MFKHFHISNQCSTLADFMLGFLLLFEGSNVFQWEIEWGGKGRDMVCTSCDVTLHDCFKDIMMHVAGSKHV